MSSYLLRDVRFAWRWLKSLYPGGERPGKAWFAWTFDRWLRRRRAKY